MAINQVTIQGNSVHKNFPPKATGTGIVLKGKFNNADTYFSMNEDLLSKHTLLVGATGCGKTNVFNFFIKQLKNSMRPEDVMIIFDTKGDYFSQFYTNKDFVVANSKMYKSYTSNWNIYKEILVDGFDDEDIYANTYEITHSLFKDAIENSTQQFFPNAARDLLSAILIAQINLGKDDMDFRKKYFNNEALKKFLDSISMEKIENLLSPDVFPDLSSVLMYLGDGTSDQALGVLAELQSVTREIFIGSFAKDGRFSIRNFVREKKGNTLFIEYDLSIGNTLAPIYRLLFDLALKEAMGRNKSSGNVYLVCDEFKLLPNLKHIEDGLNFGRSLGVKIFAGLQSIEQLYQVYGESKGKNIVAGFSNIFAFKSNDYVTRDFISNLYGKNIVLEQYKMSNNTMVEEKRQGKTVEDWDLNDLKVGEAIVGLAYERPFKFYFDLFKG